MREEKSLPRKISHKQGLALGSNRMARLVKCKSLHSLQQTKPQTSTVCAQIAVKAPLNSLRPKRIKKHLNGGQQNQKFSKEDLKHLEGVLHRDARLKTKIESKGTEDCEQVISLSDVTPLFCIQRLKTNDSKPYITISFSSDRKITELRLYPIESDVLDNTESFEEALRQTKGDDDLDTDEEIMKVATSRVVKQLQQAVAKFATTDHKDDDVKSIDSKEDEQAEQVEVKGEKEETQEALTEQCSK